MALQKKRVCKIKKTKLAIEHTVFYPYLRDYLEAMTICNYSTATLTRRDNSLRGFIIWCEARGIDSPQEVTKALIQGYQRHLHHVVQDNHQRLSPTTQNRYLSDVKQFFKWLAQENYVLYNPVADIILPKPTQTLPTVLSENEIETLMQQPEISTLQGLRDRAILEVFYSTGIRRSELCALELANLSLVKQTLFVRQGKGSKDRLLPIGGRACYWLKRYLEQVRPRLINDEEESLLFLNNYGEAFRDTKLGDKVKRYLIKAGIHVQGSCHLLRHAMATHMLENGAELRYIQAMLGHSDVRATQVYTHVSIRKLQEIHTATHPAKPDELTEL